jgi:DNA polymerase III epsilon subunit-like protein
MRVLVFDTETTGLPQYYDIPAHKRADNWPHIVSISWMVLEDEAVTTHSYIVKPEWRIPPESTAIHGIGQEQALREGVSLREALDAFQADLDRADRVVAHNLEFDKNVVVNANLWDLGRVLPFPAGMCSMRLATPLCKLPNAYGGMKPPKLWEMYLHVFGAPPLEGRLHNSLYDVEVLVKVIQAWAPLRAKMNLPALLPTKQENAPQTNPWVLRL